MWIYIWLGITALALIIEFITADIVSVWFAGGGIVSLILVACGLEQWYIHIPAFIVVSFVLLLSFRKLVLKVFDKGNEKTCAEAVIGKEFTLLTPIKFNSAGSIKVNDVIWSAVTECDKDEVPEGSVVRIKELKGNKYIVEVV